MQYSAWGRQGIADTLVTGIELPVELRQIEPGLELIKIFEADSWKEACQQYHAWQGWEPYKPMLLPEETNESLEREWRHLTRYRNQPPDPLKERFPTE